TAGQTLTVTSTSVVRNGVETVAYTGVEGLTVNGGDGGDTIQVLSTSAATPVTVNGQGGDDRIVVSSDPSGNGVLSGLAGPLTVDGGSGSNALTTSESALGKSDSVLVTSTQITAGSIPFPILYQSTGGTFGGGVTVAGPAAASTLVVESTLAGGPTT